ncbi:hypothetical protein [Nonomuraea sp. LPB2021202275-12-8]
MARPCPGLSMVGPVSLASGRAVYAHLQRTAVQGDPRTLDSIIT